MNKITDEMIMAFVDGELHPELSEKVFQAIQNDSEIRKKAAAFRETKVLLQSVFIEYLNTKDLKQLQKRINEIPIL